MFLKQISETKITSDIANQMFPNIIGMSYGTDRSFVATLRALLANRLPSDEKVYVGHSSTSYSKDVISSNPTKDVLNAIIGSSENIRKGGTGYLHIHSFHGTSDGNEACLQLVKDNLDWFLPGFREVSDLGTFVKSKKVNATFFINEEQKSFIVFVEQMDIKKWHFLQAFVTRYFPWYFKDSPLSDAETRLIKSLTTRYAPEYECALEEISSAFNFREAIIRASLAGFEKVFERDKLRVVRDSIESNRTAIQALESRFSEYYKEIERLTTEELGLLAKINGSDSEDEIMEYFLCNKSLNLVSTSRGQVKFVVATTISNFDPDVFDSAISNRNSFYYRDYDTGEKYSDKFTDDQIDLLMRAIFETEELKLRVCAAYSLDFKGGSYAGIRDYPFGSEFCDYIPNQHIQRFSCLGGNEQYIRDALLRHDYVGAVEACVASAKNFNTGETYSGSHFMKGILSPSAGRIIQMPDGSTATPTDAVKWLEENRK